MKIIEILIFVIPFFIVAFILYDVFLRKSKKIIGSKHLSSVSVTNDDYLSIIRIPAVKQYVNNRQPNRGKPFEEKVYVDRISSTLLSFLKVKNELVKKKNENKEF